MSYNPKKSEYRFAGNDGSKPIVIQDGRVYDLKGNCLDAQFASENSAVNLIQWLWDKNYCITPEARKLIITEKQRVALERQTAELIRRNQRLVEEETARMEQQLAVSEKVVRDQIDLHLKKPERIRPPLTLTAEEERVLGGGATVAETPPAPDLSELVPQEMEELAAVVTPRSAKSSSKKRS